MCTFMTEPEHIYAKGAILWRRGGGRSQDIRWSDWMNNTDALCYDMSEQLIVESVTSE